MSFRPLFDELAAIGRTPTGGWQRFAWTEEDRAARDWFERTAASLALPVECDRNGNLWAWWGTPGPGAVVTGSHLDTVAEGGAYDGALGVVSGFEAIRAMCSAGNSAPDRPIAVVAFADEEGGRFNTPCLGSKLMTGAIDPGDVVERTDTEGVTMRQAVAETGLAVVGLGPDPERLAMIGTFVELHVEQGRGLIDRGAPIAVGTEIWPHGRWRVRLTGEANHAGTTRMADRHDPLVVAGQAIKAARTYARRTGIVATVGRVQVEPNSPNSIPGHVILWLDVRAANDELIDEFIREWSDAVSARGDRSDIEIEFVNDSRSAGVEFDAALRKRIAAAFEAAGIPTVELPTAAGHDAGILAAQVPTAMLFVRNPTGASHTPTESASDDDCLTGIRALAVILEDLACD